MRSQYDYRILAAKIDSPCKGCQDRHTACHGSCSKYAKWNNERQELLAKKEKDRLINDAIIDLNYRTHKSIKAQMNIRK